MLLTPNLHGGGAERVLINLLRSFDRRRLAPRLVAADLAGPLVKQLPQDADVADLGVRRIRYVLPKLVGEINRSGPDVVLSAFERMNFALLMAKPFLRNRPRIVIREVNLPSRSLAEYGGSRRRLYQALYRKLYPGADLIIAQSERMREEIMAFAGVGPDRVVTIHNPIDVAAIGKLSDRPSPYAETGGAGCNVAAVGRLEFQKGFDLLIRAFRVFLDRRPGSRLYLLGEGSLRAELSGLAASLGIGEFVHFVGFRDNPYPYIRHADLFVLPSRYEGFPNVLLEALACRANIVAADCPSGPREILSREEYGLLVPPNDPDGLAEGMLRRANDAAGRSSGYARAMDYDCSVITGKYEQVLIG
jgi:glycosyltransferase involved in cell wall biosynthesis